MFLNLVELHNVRAFVDAEIELPERGVVLLVGSNNAGKSALLAAIDVIAGVQVQASLPRVASTDAYVAATFACDDADRRSIFEGSAHLDDWLATKAFKTVRITFVQAGDRASPVKVETTDLEGALQVIGEATFTSPGSAEIGQVRSASLHDIVRREPSAGLFEATGTTSGSLGPDALFAHGNIGLVRVLWDQWRDRFYHFHALRQGTMRDAPSHGATRLTPTGQDLPQALLHLKTNDDPAWDAIVAIMQDVVPDVGVLITPVGGDRVRVAFIDPHLGAQHNIKDLGTGVEQLLMTTYVGVRQPERSVIIVEEPETNLHSGAQRALLRYIREWSRERLFILATHSPIFLDESLGQSRVYLVERASGVATVRNVGSALADVLLALEVRLSDVLSAEHIVLVEGESDAEVIRAWFPDLTIARGVAIASMGGGDRVWASDTLTRVLDRVDELDRTILVLRDRDELPENAIDALAARGNVHVLARRELENYLLDVPAIRTVLDAQAYDFGGERVCAMSANEIEALLRNTADALKPVVVLKRVVAMIPNIRVVTRDDVATLVAAGPSQEGLLELIRGRLRPADERTEEIRATWSRVAQETDAEWDERWRDLAPGSEVLDAIWKAHGGSFDKARDGVMIAAAMSEPPEDLRSAIEAMGAAGK